VLAGVAFSSGSSTTPACSGGRKASLLTLFTQLFFTWIALSLLCSAETETKRQAGYLLPPQSIHLLSAPIAKGLNLNFRPSECQGNPWVSGSELHLWEKSVDSHDISFLPPSFPSSLLRAWCTFKCTWNSRDPKEKFLLPLRLIWPKLESELNVYNQGMLRTGSTHWDRRTILTKHLSNIYRVSYTMLASGMLRVTIDSHLECPSLPTCPNSSYSSADSSDVRTIQNLCTSSSGNNLFCLKTPKTPSLPEPL
jgi:hypothetical protein